MYLHHIDQRYFQNLFYESGPVLSEYLSFYTQFPNLNPETLSSNDHISSSRLDVLLYFSAAPGFYLSVCFVCILFALYIFNIKLIIGIILNNNIYATIVK